MKMHSWRVGWVLLVVVAGVVSSCGLSAFNEFEAMDEAREAIRRGDTERLAQLVNEHSGLRSEDAQLLFLGSTACRPEMAQFMIDELDFRADIELRGWGVLNTILAPRAGDDALPECPTGVLVDTLRILLEAGADPCVSSEGNDASRPLLAAEAWGYSEAVTDELNSHGFSC